MCELGEQRSQLLQLLQLPLDVLQEQVPRGPPGSSLGEMACTQVWVGVRVRVRVRVRLGVRVS